ncbi:MAG: helicase-associated domain-containing protein [Planctomycetes bacterium]|nr:helicase-associated domain-containing protein [Planctomycetota bacterium]
MSRLSLRALLLRADEEVVRDCARQWCRDAEPPSQRRAAIAAAAGGMEDETLVLQRLTALPRKLQDLLELFFADDGAVRSVKDLIGEVGGAFKSRFDLEATLAALHREGFLWPAKADAGSACDDPRWGVPGELVECVREYRRRAERELQDSLTLQGFLDARYFRDRGREQGTGDSNGNGNGNGSGNGRSADHARKIYKLYTMESSMRQRAGKLAPPLRALVDDVLVRYGGIAAWSDLVADTELDDGIDPEFVGKSLEEAMLGLVGPLDLARIGIQPIDQAVIVFHELALFLIRERGASAIPTVTEALVCGGDFATNVCRFLRELQQSKVLFTADGKLFKASQKRIAGLLLPVPGGFLPPESLLEELYRFALQRRLIDRRGERSLRPTPAGQEFDRSALAEQTKMLLAHFVEDRSLPGETYHQVRMRRVLLRLLRRAEPMLWQDAAILPFLARNAYLAQLDSKPAEEFFATRFQGGGYTPSETLQQMCWNLLVWVKKRLFPLGLVDLGLQSGRLVAMRLSQLGTELLDAEPAAKVGGTRSSLVVQPDFEVLLFGGDDVHDVAHFLDRFARRIKSDHVLHFKLERTTVAAGLAEGLTVAAILQELTDRARVPVPQNVRYSLEEWGGEKSP